MNPTAPFAYNIEPELARRNPTGVFRLLFGKKYFIFKGLRIVNTIEGLSKQIHREKFTPKEDSILFKAVAYVRKARITVMEAELLFESDAIVDVLLAEYEALQAAKNDPDCLNTRFYNNEYFPNWIPQAVINDFNSRLQGTKATDSDKNLKRFLTRNVKDPATVQKVMDYVTTHFRAASRRKKNESLKNIPQK
jgi:hypothetical protein